MNSHIWYFSMDHNFAAQVVTCSADNRIHESIYTVCIGTFVSHAVQLQLPDFRSPPSHTYNLLRGIPRFISVELVSNACCAR